MLLSNCRIDNTHRVSVLSTVAPNNEVDLEGDELFNSIKYEKVASIIRSSDSASSQATPKVITASSANAGKMSRKEIEEKKKTTKCGRCGEIGHWWKDDICPLKNKKESDVKNDKNKNTIQFN